MDETLLKKVYQVLATVKDPEINKDLISLNMIKEVKVEDKNVYIEIELTTPACPLKKEIENSVSEAVKNISEVKNVEVKLSGKVKKDINLENKILPPGVKTVIAVASGKGGVGKSTVSVNLAAALSVLGAKVGLIDGDIYGPNIPKMLGVNTKPEVTAENKIIPLEAFGIKIISIGLFVDEKSPLIWRGPMLHSVMCQFLQDVQWGEIDYLVVDLPPGTGDVQLSLTQLVPLSGIIMVTTPQEVSIIDVKKALEMFKQVNVPVLGLIENMSYFICPHCSEQTNIFGSNGAQILSNEYNVPLLGKIPLQTNIREGGDNGKPVVIFNPQSEEAKIFFNVASSLAGKISIAVRG